MVRQIEISYKKTIPLVFIILVLLTTSQDYLEARLFHQGFYLSESLLFKVSWLLFIPVIFILTAVWKPRSTTVNTVYNLIFFALLLSAIHLLSATAITAFVAQNSLQLPFTFAGLGKYLLIHEFLPVLFIYSIVLGSMQYAYLFRNGTTETLSTAHPYAPSITVRQGKKLIPLPVEDICCIKSAAPYVDICIGDKHYLHQSNLKQISKILDPDVFARIHRSAIVNVHCIQEIRSRSNGDYDVLLQDGTLLRWSRHYHQGLKKALHLGAGEK